MVNVDFARFHYYPALQSSDAEHLGYRNLSNQDKDAILPIFELSQRRNEPNLDSAIEAIRTSGQGRAFILDLCKDPAPPAYVPRNDSNPERTQQIMRAQESYNERLAQLLDPADGFRAWRSMVAEFPNCIPVIQFTDPNGQSLNILRQCALLSQGGARCVAIRIVADTDSAIHAVVGQMLAVMQSAANVLIIIDCGQARSRRAERVEFAQHTITSILNGVDAAQRADVRAVLLSSSFNTPSRTCLDEPYPSHDWDTWREACEVYPFTYGDYGAYYRRRRQNTFVPGDWVATVVYPLDEGWMAYRHLNQNDPTGWVDGSRAISEHDFYRPPLEAWGSEIIEAAADGDIENVQSSRFWDAVRVNLHIHRQIRYAESQLTGDGSDV